MSGFWWCGLCLGMKCLQKKLYVCIKKIVFGFLCVVGVRGCCDLFFRVFSSLLCKVKKLVTHVKLFTPLPNWSSPAFTPRCIIQKFLNRLFEQFLFEKIMCGDGWCGVISKYK